MHFFLSYTEWCLQAVSYSFNSIDDRQSLDSKSRPSKLFMLTRSLTARNVFAENYETSQISQIIKKHEALIISCLPRLISVSFSFSRLNCTFFILDLTPLIIQNVHSAINCWRIITKTSINYVSLFKKCFSNIGIFSLMCAECKIYGFINHFLWICFD